jgi:hypothetical protein
VRPLIALGLFAITVPLTTVSAEEKAYFPHFARAALPAEAALNALAIAELRIDENNCLRHGDSAVIWHHDTVAERTDDNRTRIIDGFNGKAVYVGEVIAMAGGGGAGITTWDGVNIAQPPPPNECSGSIWSGGPVSTAEETRELQERLANRPVVAPPPGF